MKSLDSKNADFRFKRKEHLKKKKDIGEVFSKGKRVACKEAKMFVLENKLPYNRICFTFPRAFGNSVKRNHTKRLCREVYRNFKPQLKAGFDVIVLTYPDNQRRTYAMTLMQLSRLLSKAGLLL
ncbi:MAG: ribonuclease P protein component [Treponema sp.]|nr:ribonuclease P protein component [Treponema sp.]